MSDSSSIVEAGRFTVSLFEQRNDGTYPVRKWVKEESGDQGALTSGADLLKGELENTKHPCTLPTDDLSRHEKPTW